MDGAQGRNRTTDTQILQHAELRLKPADDLGCVAEIAVFLSQSASADQRQLARRKARVIVLGRHQVGVDGERHDRELCPSRV
jgi:hypothetical protein